MSQCQRCGANNESTSRFCVSCGSPLAQKPPPGPVAGTARPPDPAQAPNPVSQALPPGEIVYPPPVSANSYGGPPSSSLQFAETASPPTREEFAEFERQRVAAQAAAAAMRAQAAPVQHAPASGYRSAAPPSPRGYPVGAQPETAAMPGVSQDPEDIPEGAPRLLAGFLISYDTHPLGRFWPIYQGRTRVGRQGSGAELDIELDHPTTSSRHAVLLAAACPGRIKLEDSGSTNGTMLNGARLGSGSKHELKDGDRVRFGLLSTIVKIV
jgi:hypothetical protein